MGDALDTESSEITRAAQSEHASIPEIVDLNTQINAQIDEVLHADPFTYREKLKPLLDHPKDVLKMLSTRLSSEDDMYVKGKIHTTMAWMSEQVEIKDKATSEEVALLNQATDSVIQTIRSTESLTLFQNAVITLNRFDYNSEHFFNQLDNLSWDVFLATQDRANGIEASESEYKLHNVTFDNDLLEQTLEKLHEHDHDNTDLLTTISKLEPKQTGPLYSRIIYKARRWLNKED